MKFEDIYEIAMRIENAQILLNEGDIEQTKQVLKNVLLDLRRVIYPNDPFEIIDSLRGD